MLLGTVADLPRCWGDRLPTSATLLPPDLPILVEVDVGARLALHPDSLPPHRDGLLDLLGGHVAAAAGPPATPATMGAWYQGWRLMSIDGSPAMPG